VLAVARDTGNMNKLTALPTKTITEKNLTTAFLPV
jgi:hypothetical protein